MIVKLADNIISPLGVGTQENYEAVKAGRSSLRAYPATELLPEGYFASLIDDSVLEPLYASLGLGPESGYTVFEKRCIACAAPAIRDAGIDPASPRTIFIISTTKANVELLDGYADAGSDEKASADAESKVSADSLPGCHHSVGAGCADRARPDALPDRRTPASAALQVSRYFGNPNTPLVVSNACISGLAAQIEAMRALDAGEFDFAVVIGADVVGRFVISGFQSLKALSPEQCRPFDAARCGLNLGEAAACIVYGAAGAVAPAPTAASVAAASEPSLNRGQNRDGAAENTFPSLNRGQNRDGAAENTFPSMNQGQNRDGAAENTFLSLNQGQNRDGAAENAFSSLNRGQIRDGAVENAFTSLNRDQNRDGGSRRLWVAAAGAICNDANHISGPSRTGEGSYRALVQTLGLDYRPWPATSAAPATSATPAAPATSAVPATPATPTTSATSAAPTTPATSDTSAAPFTSAASPTQSAASVTPVSVGDIAFVNVHGTSTLYNDEMESFAITRAGLQNTPVNTLKGYFGHTLGAAGVLETILSMAAVEDGTILGTRGFESIGVSNTLRLTAEHSAIKGGKRSFVKLLSGFGGCNAAMLFRLSDASAACDSAPSAASTSAQSSARASALTDPVKRNTLAESDLREVDAPKCRTDFQESAENQIFKKNARLKKLHSVEISPSAVLLDGAPLQVEGAGPALLENLYRSHVGDWPKFFKMDPLARLGFLASELLLRSAGQGGCGHPLPPLTEPAQNTASAAPCPLPPLAEPAPAPQTIPASATQPAPAVILFNRSGSLADDINYQAGIDGPDHLGSPSLFVYTLPNIVTGEIAIRNKFLSETSFYCIPEPDEQLMQSIVARALEPGQRAICGWCECSSEDDFWAKMCILAS